MPQGPELVFMNTMLNLMEYDCNITNRSFWIPVLVLIHVVAAQWTLCWTLWSINTISLKDVSEYQQSARVLILSVATHWYVSRLVECTVDQYWFHGVYYLSLQSLYKVSEYQYWFELLLLQLSGMPQGPVLVFMNSMLNLMEYNYHLSKRYFWIPVLVLTLVVATQWYVCIDQYWYSWTMNVLSPPVEYK